MDRAASRMLLLQSATFTLEHLKGTTILFPGLEMRKVTGVVAFPDKFRLAVEAESTSSRSFVPIDIVAVGRQAYITNFVNQQWQQVPLDALPFSIGDLGRTLSQIIQAVESPRPVGTEQTRGRSAYRIQGRITSEALAALVPGAAMGLPVGIELWLEQRDGLLLQALITGQAVGSDPPDAVRRLTLDQIDVPVTITTPP